MSQWQIPLATGSERPTFNVGVRQRARLRGVFIFDGAAVLQGRALLPRSWDLVFGFLVACVLLLCVPY